MMLMEANPATAMARMSRFASRASPASARFGSKGCALKPSASSFPSSVATSSSPRHSTASRRSEKFSRARVTEPVLVSRIKDSWQREREVLEKIVGGASNKEAGRALGISPRTIEVHRSRVMEKLGARNGADLARIVFSDG